MQVQIPGRKVHLIFSVCNIKQFPETIEQLGEEIVSLVNRLIKIIHEVSEVWDGIPTNNYGDKYILTWRIPFKDETKKLMSDLNKSETDKENNELDPNLMLKIPNPYAPWIKEEVDEFADLTDADIPKKRTELADKALISAVKTIAEIERDKGLEAYQRHPRIKNHFDGGYKTTICFSLHIGVTIEGSIGTEMKIDYLNISPDQ